jgi:hypothetical protein
MTEKLFRVLALSSLAIVFPLLTGCGQPPSIARHCLRGHDVRAIDLFSLFRDYTIFVCDEYAPSDSLDGDACFSRCLQEPGIDGCICWRSCLPNEPRPAFCDLPPPSFGTHP